MRGKFVVGNWKMNGGLAANAALLAELAAGWTPESSGSTPESAGSTPESAGSTPESAGSTPESAGSTPESGRRIAVCVPYPYLAQVGDALRATTIAWGAQDVSEHPSGAFTGEVSAGMLVEFGCRYVIVGHSERRQLYGDTDAVVAAKAVAALAAGLAPIACVGETLAERDAGATMAVVSRQLDAVLAAVSANASRLVVAYEPVWAIGTGRTASPEAAQEVHAMLRGRLARSGAADVALLYGGSVKADNAKSLFAMADIDGGLIGGASLKAAEFLAIARA